MKKVSPQKFRMAWSTKTGQYHFHMKLPERSGGWKNLDIVGPIGAWGNAGPSGNPNDGSGGHEAWGWGGPFWWITAGATIQHDGDWYLHISLQTPGKSTQYGVKARGVIGSKNVVVTGEHHR